MFNEFRNYLLKASALIGCAAVLLYFAPGDQKVSSFDEEEIQNVEPTEKTPNQLSKYNNMRKPASINEQSPIESASTTQLSEESNTNFENENQFIPEEDPSLRNLAESSGSFENSLPDERGEIQEQQDQAEAKRNSNPQTSDDFQQEPRQSSGGSSSDIAATSAEVNYAIPGCAENCSANEDNSDTAQTNSGESTASTDSSEGTTSTPTNPTADVAPVVTADLGAGNYSENPSVTLSSNIGGEIYYCVAEGSCCEPNPSSGGTLYNAAIDIGTGDGNFCLSFVGIGQSGILGEQVTQSYIVDQTLPDMSSIVDVQYIQTTGESSIAINSSKFGSTGYDYGLYNLSADPSALNCKQVEENFAHATYGVDFDGNSSPDLYDLSSIFTTITSPLRPGIMNYGAGGNYFVSILSNRNFAGEAKRNCVTHKVVLEDFDYLASTQTSTSAPIVNGSGHMEYSGTFNSYGIFREPAAIGDASITSGSSRFEADANNILEATKEDIIY